ncbi:YggS family pyridoxal phosphate-dependent enzyme [Emcibacter sp. SYSU 3D8]|uniref:YggS family pyridoxal phosphate-dependent enzyme n=1 Tax=Emcibacter sp. SYSU 3D8 TaxID=3133969 RepID=UPI0031FEDB28
MTPTASQIAAHLAEVRARIDKAARAGGRSGADVTLIAVSKTHPAEVIELALAAGQRHFGENRVQEAEAKWPALKAKYPDVVLHLIGGLQTNKVKDALSLFDVIHTIDRPRLAEAIARHGAETGALPVCFVQVNTGEEDQKGGVMPLDTDAFVAECRDVHGLTLAGLMCIPPVGDPPAPHFALLKKFARRNGLAGLSMGMSSDYEKAAEMGATHVRVGSAIFGARG